MLEPAWQPKGFAMVRGRLIKSGWRGKWSAASRERSRARRERARRLLLLLLLLRRRRLLVLLVVLLRVAVTVAVAVTAAAILATGETRFAGVTCRRHHPVHTPDTVHAAYLYTPASPPLLLFLETPCDPRLATTAATSLLSSPLLRDVSFSLSFFSLLFSLKRTRQRAPSSSPPLLWNHPSLPRVSPRFPFIPFPRPCARFAATPLRAYGYVSPSPYGPVGYGPGVGVGPVAVPSDVPGYDEGHPVQLPSGVPPGMFDDEVHLQRLQSRHPVVPGMASPLDDDQKSMRWRDPNLSEVIGFLSNPNNIIKANAAAYLQHLCYMDDPNKQKTRSLGGIPPLVQLLDHDNPDVYRNACGALRNLSYGRQNDENKRAIKNAGGVPALINLLRRTSDADVKELVTGVLWNLSSCEVGTHVCVARSIEF